MGVSEQDINDILLRQEWLSRRTEIILQNLRARLPATGESLLLQYEKLCWDTGTKTTPEDAFAAWGRWLGSHPYEIEDWPEQYHQKVAAVIREVARYI